MEQRKEGAAAVSPSGKGPRLRRKLQKSVPKQQSNTSSWFGSGAPKPVVPSNQPETTNISRPLLPRRPSSLPFLDPSNIQRFEFSQRNGCFYEPETPLEEETSLENPRDAPRIIPELAHLVTTNTQPKTFPPPKISSTSPRPEMRRRRAKTPIFTIGQLEDIPRPSNAPGRASSVDLIADQYDALIQFRRSSTQTDSHSHSEPASPRGDDYSGYDYTYDDANNTPPTAVRRRRHSSVYLRDGGEIPLCAPPLKRVSTTESTEASPTSDDGTLVSFDEERVYFKPVSFHSGPTSPFSPPENNNNLPPTGTETSHGHGQENLSLQICLDLLTRELSSAFVGRPSRPSPSTSSLQVWVMIEAYEKLRDQLAERARDDRQVRALEVMFDVWLRALYSIHDSFEGGGGGNGNGKWETEERDFRGDLEGEALD